MKILVTGASGFVGTHLCEKLLKEGHEVFALVRSPNNFELKDSKLTVIQGDLNNQHLSWTTSLPEDLETCIHTAGIVHSYTEADFFRINSLGTLYLINALKKKFQRLHFILISSLAAAGPSDRKTKKTETEINFPISAYGRSKNEAEETLRTNAPASWDTAIIRPPMVIGPKDTAVLDIFKMVQSGFILLPGINSKNKKYSFVCVFDLVETIYLTISKRKVAIYYSAHPQTISFNELILEVKKQLKKNWIFYIYLPMILVRLLAMFLNFVYKIKTHSLRLTPDKIFELEATNWTCDGARTESELNQTYQYNLDRTIKVTLDDYKFRHWI